MLRENHNNNKFNVCQLHNNGIQWFTVYINCDKTENEMGGTRNTYGKRKVAYRVLVAKPEGKRPFGGPRIILKWIFRKWEVRVLTELIGQV